MADRGARVVIRRPAADVFRYLVDLHDAQWRSGVREMRLVSDSADGIGARHVEVRRVPGRTIETTAEVVEYLPDRRWTVRRATGPVRPQVQYSLRPVDAGTELTMTFTLPVLSGPAFVLRPVAPLVGRLVERSSGADLRRLRAALEASAR